jgi:hypothetical protein
MKYSGVINQEFMDYLNKKVSEDTRDPILAARQWSFEFPERHLCSVKGSGHILNEGFEYDTNHEFFGKCDFKYHNKEGVIRLTNYVYKNIAKGFIDTFITWKWIGRNPNEAVRLNEKVKYELIMYIDAETVYNNAILNGDKYEYFYSG